MPSKKGAPESVSKKQSHWPLSVLGGLTSILNVFLPLSLVRVLTPDEIGQYKVFFLYVTMTPLFGLTVGVTNGLFFWTGNKQKRGEAFRASWTIILGAALLILALGTALHGKLVHWLSWTPAQVWLFVWASFLTVVASFYEDVKIASGEIWRGALFSSGFEATRNALIMICALHFRTIDSVMWTYTVMMTAKTLYGMYLGHREGFQKMFWNRDIWRSVIAYAAPISVAGLLSMFTAYGDQLLLSGVLPAAQFAIYSLGCLAVPPLTIFEISVNRVLIPNLALAFNEGKNQRACLLYRESISELAWLLIPASVALSLFAEPIVLLLFRAKYLAAADFLRIYAFAYIAFILPYDVVARARGQGSWILKFLIFFTPPSIGAVYLGAKLNGAMGVLITVMIIRFAMRFGSIAWVARTEKWNLRDMIPFADLLRYSFVSAVAATAAYAVGFWIKQPILWLICGGAVFSLIYLVTTTSSYLRKRSRILTAPPVILLAKYPLNDKHGWSNLLALARSLSKTGHWTPVVYICGTADSHLELQSQLERAGVQALFRPTGGVRTLLFVLTVLKQVLRSKAAVIHSHSRTTRTYAMAIRWLTLGAVQLVHTRSDAWDACGEHPPIAFKKLESIA